MSLLISGRIGSLTSIILVTAVILYYMRLSKTGKKFEIRKPPALYGIEEAVGRCAETDRPLHFNCGLSHLRGSSAAPTMAGINVLSFTSEICARNGSKMIITCSNYQQLPFIREAANLAFLNANQVLPEEYVRFVGQGQHVLAAACQGIFERENIGANIMIGVYDEECIQLVEKGFRVGAIGIGGSNRLGQVAIMAAAMDYVLIGEEIYAAAAYVTGDSAQMAMIYGADIPKIAAVIVIMLGLILVNFGISLPNLLRI